MSDPVSGFRILVVEDEPSLLMSIVDLLAFHGHSAYGAKNGAHALQCVAEYLPDLVISDVMMPVMDGHQLVRRLREMPETAQMPIILFSGHTSPHLMQDGLAAGASFFIQKPFELDEFLDMVDEVLAAARQ